MVLLLLTFATVIFVEQQKKWWSHQVSLQEELLPIIHFESSSCQLIWKRTKNFSVNTLCINIQLCQLWLEWVGFFRLVSGAVTDNEYPAQLTINWHGYFLLFWTSRRKHDNFVWVNWIDAIINVQLLSYTITIRLFRMMPLQFVWTLKHVILYVFDDYGPSCRRLYYRIDKMSLL